MDGSTWPKRYLDIRLFESMSRKNRLAFGPLNNKLGIKGIGCLVIQRGLKPRFDPFNFRINHTGIEL